MGVGKKRGKERRGKSEERKRGGNVQRTRTREEEIKIIKERQCNAKLLRYMGQML